MAITAAQATLQANARRDATAINPYRYLRICAWSGPAVLIACIFFWGVLGQNIPPYAADLSASDFASAFRDHMYLIRTGMVGMLVFMVLYMTWGMAITKVMQQVERDNDILSTLQLWGAGFTTVVFALACSTWLTATFRADTLNAELLQLMYDFGWIQFDMCYTLTTLQLVAMGVCFLGDRRPVPLFPKWLCWFSIWVGFMFFLLSVMPFFKGGPFARSGILNYWTEFMLFFLFMALASAYLINAVSRLEREHADAPRAA